MTAPRVYHPLDELAEPGRLPLGELLDDVMEHVWLAAPSYDPAANEGVIGVFVDREIAVTLPGIPAVQLALGSAAGGVDFDIRARLQPTPFIGIEVPLTLRVDAEILRPLKADTNEPDLERTHLDVALATVLAGFDIDGNLTFDVPAGVSVPRCMIGSTGVIIEIGALRWLTPQTDLTNDPAIAAAVPPNFTGLYLENVRVEVTSLPIQAGQLSLEYGFIGTGGFTGAIDWSDAAVTWNGNDFENGLHGDLFGFKGALSRVKLGFRQNALTECEVEGNVFVPYLDRVIGLSLGLDGSGDVTAVARTPTCAFDDAADATAAGPAGYLITADTAAFTLDISRIELHAGGGASAALALSGRAKLKVSSFDLPAVVFQGLRIDTQGHVAVDGGWLDVDTAKSSALSGFPFQITKIGFGAETPRRRWIGFNGGLKLADGLPIGASVEGLRVIWDLDQGVSFTLEGVGLELSVPGTFSFAGKVAFFSNAEATGFRGTLRLKLDTLKLSIDAALMIGRTSDGTSFFFFYLDAGLPAGIPLFSTGAAIYGFAGLLAVNLKPARAEGEDWYYGYYKRPAPGVTDPAKWAIQRDAFAIGLGTTLGSLPDAGFAFSAKVMLVLVLPGPQLLLQGKGQFVSKKPNEKDASAEGAFEALLILDIPAKLFQANLTVAFRIGDLIEVAGGVDVAFSWSPSPPADIWHVYLGEKLPAERRIHATLFKLLHGDSWLMINRAHRWPPGLPGRAGDFEIGGSLGVDFKFDFSVVKAWLEASIVGEAAITWDPQQFTASVTLKGSAGVSALGLSVIADLLAAAAVRAPNPWFLTMEVEVGIKIDLLLVKWEFHARLPLEFGDESQPLPEPVTGIAEVSADHAKADEAGGLDGAIVAPDARPIVSFRRPVQDLARFGAPGRDDIPADDLSVRQVSYRLRHVVLIATGGPAARLVGAAGQLTVSGNTVTFAGLGGPGDGLPALAGAELTLFRPGEAARGPFAVTGGGATASVSGSPPQGEFSYRLSAPRPSTNVQVAGVGAPAGGDLTLTLAGSLATPGLFRGGSLVAGSASWLVLEATAGAVRVRAGAGLPSAGAATLLGPAPATIEGKWYPAGDPVTGVDSSTRLQLWAKTPYAFFRHNELSAIAGLDAFRPDYACGPEAVEQPICTSFDDVPAGPLAGAFSSAGIGATASGRVAAVVSGTGTARRLELGMTVAGGGMGRVTFDFEPPVDAVWITAEARESGWVTAWNGAAAIDRRPIGRRLTMMEFSGGVDRVEIDGADAMVHRLCFLPGWTCITFDEASFPPPRSGEISYAGVTFASDGVIAVDVDTLEVEPPAPPTATVTLVRPRTGERIAERTATTTTTVSSRAQAMTVDSGEMSPEAMPMGAMPGSLPPELPMAGLVEPVTVTLPRIGTVTLVPGLTPLPTLGVTPQGPVVPALPPSVLAGDLRDRFRRPPTILTDTGRVWVDGSKARLATVTIVFPRPATRVRVQLASGAGVIAFAGTLQVTRGTGAAGSVVSLHAEPAGATHLGWIDRFVITGASQVRVAEVCTDRGDFGWQRYEQWKWSQGVRRSVESLYVADPVLAPGSYELRVHTAAVVTGASPREDVETGRATFTVGEPPGFPVAAAASALPGVYPVGGPLTELATYVARTMPAAGARLWYRGYDTAVGFNESYVTRMYLEAGHELRVFVVNASGVAVRSSTRHVWSGSDASLDAWTDLYVRTLNGDGTDPCATVSVDRIVSPELVTAGNGEPLEPGRLHASELRTADATSRVVHRFEFTTSRYVSFRHHLVAFDGRCRRLASDAARSASSLAPRDRALAHAARLASLATAITAARNARALASTGTPSQATLDAAAAALDALALARADVRRQGADGFGEIWRACFGTRAGGALPDALRLSVVEAATATGGTDVLLLESPEPIAWDRVAVSLAKAGATPRRRITTTVASDFGRPDAGFEVGYGGMRWLAGVELWVVDGAVRARASEPLSVTLYPERASTVELVILVDEGGSATIDTVPPMPGGAVVRGPSSLPVIVQLTAAAGSPITGVTVTGSGVGIESCTVTAPFVPVPPSGVLRIASVTLPTVAHPLDHDVTLLAMEGMSAGGYVVQWTDATAPAASQLYASVTSVELGPGQRIRLVPSRATAAPIDDAVVQVGGPGTSPPMTGAVYQLIDPDGRVVHEVAVMPVAAAGAASVVAFPNEDETRAFLVAPSTAQAIGTGHWVLGATLSGDVAPDLDRWSISGVSVVEKALLRLEIR